MKEMRLQAKSKRNTKIADAVDNTSKHTAVARKPAAVSSKQTIKKPSQAVLMPEKLDIANKFLAGLIIPD